MITSQKDRIDVRISREQKELVKQASELRGFKSVSDFIVTCINTEANRILEDENRILKTLEDKKLFVDMLLNPQEPNDKLKSAHQRYLNHIGAHTSTDRNAE